MYKKIFMVLSIALCNTAPYIVAAPGDLDTTFNAGGPQPGTVTTIWPTSDTSDGNAIALQTDGKIVVAGSVVFPSPAGTYVLVERFNTNGVLDEAFPPFAIDTNLSYVPSVGNSVVIQTDGKIVVAGTTGKLFGNLIISRFGVARLNTDGTLDAAGFNSGGVQPGTVSTNIDNLTTNYNFVNQDWDAFGKSVALQTDGKIVVVGTTNFSTGESLGLTVRRIAVARFNTNGTLDMTFNAGGAEPGTLSFVINDATAQNGNGVVIQPDGKIVVTGNATIRGVEHMVVVRFNTNGSLDTTFNASGVQPGTITTTVSNARASGNSVTLQPDGKIVVAGDSCVENFKFAVARFNVDGTLDATFNAAGIQPGTASTRIDSVSNSSVGQSVGVQTDGKIVVAGYALIGPIYKFSVARFNADGTVDETFNAAGTRPSTVSTTIDNVNSFSFGRAVAIQTDGNIVVAGSALESEYRIGVARFEGGDGNPPEPRTNNTCAQQFMQKYGSLVVDEC